MKRISLLEPTGFNQLVKGREGYFLYNWHDLYIGQAIDTYGESGGFESHLLQQMLRPGNVVIEVGSNIGAHTVGIARQVGPTGAVFAIEPQRLVFQTLCANIALNSLANVECHWAAMGAQPGFVTVPELDPDKHTNFSAISLRNVPAGREVPCMVLDDFVDLPQLHLIKIDVEGMEGDVIEGGREMIGKFKPVLYVANDRPDASEALLRLIGGLGYRLYWHVSPLFNPSNFYEQERNIYPDLVEVNALCIHRDFTATLDGFTEIVDLAAHPLRR